MNWTLFKDQLKNEDAFFRAFPRISKDNQSLLTLFKNKYKLSMYEAMLECHLSTPFEIAKAISKSIGVSCYRRSDDLRFDLDASIFSVSECWNFGVLPQKLAAKCMLWVVDPWSELFQKAMDKKDANLEFEFGIISQDDFDLVIAKFVSMEEPVV